VKAAATPRHGGEAVGSLADRLSAPRHVGRRVLAVSLFGLAVLPVYRLLTPEAGLAGLATGAISDATAPFALTGLLVVAGLALVLGVVFGRVAAPGGIER
jgi:hypothetical protein